MDAEYGREEGLTLLEVIVALLILGVLLSGFAASLISFGRATAVNEHRVQATSLLTSLHEELQATPWNRAVLYDSEIAGLADVPGVDLSGDTPTFDGEPLVTIPGPVNAGCPTDQPHCGRLVYVPRATEDAVIDDRTFDIFRIVTEAPVTGGGEPELRRFVTVVRWTLLNRSYEQVFESVRAPTPAERDEASPPEVRLFLVNPRQIILDGSGRNRDPISVNLRLQPGGSDPRLTLNVLDDDGEPQQVTIELDVVADFPIDASSARAWSYDINAGTYRFDPANPSMELRYQRAASDGDPATTVEFPGGYRLVFRTQDGWLISAAGEAASDTAPSWFAVPTVDTASVLTPGPIYVGTIRGGNEDQLCQAVTIVARVSLDELTGVPDRDEVSVQAWFAGTRTQVEALKPLTVPATGPIDFLLTLERTAPSPWILEAGGAFDDRFHMVALAGPTSQDSRATVTTLFRVMKPSTGACEEVE